MTHSVLLKCAASGDCSSKRSPWNNSCNSKTLVSDLPLESDLFHNSKIKSYCSSTDKWINKIWYIHPVEYYSVIKSNKILIYTAAWMNLKNMLSEGSRTPKTMCCMILYMWNVQKRHRKRNRKWINGCQDVGEKNGCDFETVWGFFWESWKCSEIR